MNKTRSAAMRRLGGLWLAALALAMPLPALAATPQLVATEGNAMALDSAGTVYSWGSDLYGQTGQGRLLLSTSPRRLGTRSDLKMVSAGTIHSLMLTRGGDVYAWGGNNQGQLGDGTQLDRAEPVKVFSGAALVAAGDVQSTVVDQAGTVWQAGGYGTTASRFSAVAGVQRVTQVLHTGANTIALASDGSVWTWGDGQLGVLGFGKAFDSPAGGAPRKVPGLPVIVRLYGGYPAIFAIDRDGQVWAWGQANGIDGTDWNSFIYYGPTRLPISGRVAAISGRLVLFEDGTLRSWYPGKTITTNVVSSTERFADITPRGWRGASIDVDVLRTRTGGIWTYGWESSYGQLGRTGSETLGLVRATGTYSANAQLSTNSRTVFAVNDAGEAWVWGSNKNSQFLLPPASDLTAIAVPQRVRGLPAVTEIDSRGVFGGTSLAVGEDGSLWGWGANDDRQLGLGDQTPRSSPTRIAMPVRVRSARGGSLDSIALDVDGNVWSWGYYWSTIRHNGDLSRPTKVYFGADVVAIAKGLYFSLALRRDGTVIAWGSTSEGQTGDGTFTPDSLYNYVGPVTVRGLANIVAISAGQSHGLALDASGRVWGWGDNGNQQLGFRSRPEKTVSGRTAEPVPVAVPVTGRVVAVNAGLFSSTVLYDNGRVQVFGDYGGNDRIYAQLNKPVQAIPRSYNGDAVYLMDRDGMAYSAPISDPGSNYYGELGNGTFASVPSFKYVVNAQANGYLNLLGRSPALDPANSFTLFVSVNRTSNALTTALTDLRAAGISGDVYFSALLPANSPLLTGSASGGSGLATAPSTDATRRRALSSGKGPLSSKTVDRSRVLDGGTGGAMVAGVLTRGGFKQTGGTSYVQAEAAYTGTLASPVPVSVYADPAADPLKQSNAVICMGVTVPELSGKGQVLMRPIATGTDVQGVAQCPPVQTAATISQFRAEASGPVNARTIEAQIDPLPDDRGRVRQVFSWAVAPDGRQYMQTGPNQWEDMTEPMKPVATVTLPLSGSYRLQVTRGLDLTQLAGTLVFIGIGESWDDVRSLNKAGHYYTVR